ncbi:MAG: transaldolase [Candidatus Eremiobacteraeota bacterium]|nr:transaldolase [Candidatus Eremiobacteraeota bacterium]
MTSGRPAVFFDRDGVLNEAIARSGLPHPPDSLDDLRLAEGAREAISTLRTAGFVTICVTNQPDVARGTLSEQTADAMNAFVRRELDLDDVIACYHDDPDACSCRKPLPGMLLKGATRWSVDLSSSYMVGDRWRDIEAGDAAGCRTVYVDRDWPERPPARPPDAIVTSVTDATAWILANAGRTMNAIDRLKIKLFADGADLGGIETLARDPRIAGFTTNPTLMHKAGLSDYERFARAVLEIIGDRPISYEVFADEFPEMLRQSRKIATWGDNVYVKIPVTNTRGESATALVRELSEDGVKLNVTALMTERQVEAVSRALEASPGAYISVFAGRVADTGRDPMPIMRESVEIMKGNPRLELIWASPRELLNVFQADEAGVHVITATADILAKLALVGKDLDEYSLDTVKMFHRDAQSAGFTL